MIVDVLEEILDIQKGVEDITQWQKGLISPVSWRLRLQVVKLLVSLSCLVSRIDPHKVCLSNMHIRNVLTAAK